MRRAGFTLIELLIVIGIIMILLGLLFPAFLMIKKQAMKAKCMTLIHQIDAACDSYRTLNGAYPDSATIKSQFPLAAGKPPAVTATAIGWSTVASELLARLQTVDRDHFATMGQLVDPWKKTLRYRPVQYYPFDATYAKKVDKDPPPHPDSYQLWSTGPDETDQFGEDNSDDITNWK
jgi:prepilin-type N-terminal cleavage/methylation domain-containing protein